MNFAIKWDLKITIGFGKDTSDQTKKCFLAMLFLSFVMTMIGAGITYACMKGSSESNRELAYNAGFVDGVGKGVNLVSLTEYNRRDL